MNLATRIKNTFSNSMVSISKRISRYWRTTKNCVNENICFIAIIILWVLTKKEVAFEINDWLLTLLPSSLTLNYDIQILYLNKIFPSSTIVTPILASLFIPPFIQMYGLVRSENFLLKEIVRSKYSHYYVLKIISSFLLFAFSNSDLYSVALSSYISIELYYLYKDYFQINFERRKPTFNMLNKAFQKQDQNFTSFFKSKKSFVSTVNLLYPKENADPNMNTYNYFTYESRPNVSRFDESSFHDFANNLKSILTASISQRVVMGNENESPRYNVDPHTHWLIPSSEIENKRLIVNLRLTSDVNFDDVKEKLNALKSEYEEMFSYSSTSEEVDKSIVNYFTNFHIHIADLVENKRMREYEEEIGYMKDFLSDAEKLSKNDCRVLLRFLESLRYFLEDDYSAKLSTRKKLDIYSISERVFRISLYSSNSSFSYRASSQYIDFLAKEFVSEETYKRHVTSIISYSELTKQSIDGYLESLLSKISNVNDAETHKISLQLLTFLIEDSRGERFGVFSQEIGNYISEICESRLLLLAAQSLYQNWQCKEILYTLISCDLFFKTLNDTYTEKFGRYDFERSRERSFDRHGLGSMWSFNPFNFYRAFLIDYYSWSLNNNAPASIFKLDFDFSRQLDHLLSEASKELEQNEFDISPFKEILLKIQREKDHEIIESPLDRNRLHQYVKDCEKEFFASKRISEIIGIHKTSDILEGNAFGFNITIPREYYTIRYGSRVINQGQNGRVLASAENTAILKELKKHVPEQEVTVDHLFKSILPVVFDNSGSCIVTNIHSLNFKLFDWEGKCKFEEKLRIRFDSERNRFLSFGDNEVPIYEVRTDKNTHNPFIMIYIKSDAFRVNYSKTFLQEKQNRFFSSQDIFFTFFEDIGHNPELLKKIIESNYFGNEALTYDEKVHHLKMKIGMQQLISPSLIYNRTIELDKHVCIYSIKDFNDDI